MAVYTDVTKTQLAEFNKNYNIGDVVSLTGIKQGIENSNFVLKTTAGYYILTIYEKRIEISDLPYFLGLMEHLSLSGFPCTRPVRRTDDSMWGPLNGKQAALTTFVVGKEPTRITLKHCQQVGQTLAKLHKSGQNFKLERRNDLSINSWGPLLDKCAESKITEKYRFLSSLEHIILDLKAFWPKDLPKGPIHGDLFPDNVLFNNNKVSGFIDFYFACNDFFSYDLAVCLNAWCFNKSGSFVIERGRALLTAYARERPLESRELNAIPFLARGAALRFFLTRLYDWSHTNSDALVVKKDPRPYFKRLQFHLRISDVKYYGIDSND